MVGMVSPLSWADLNARNAEQPDGPAPMTQTRLDEEVDIVFEEMRLEYERWTLFCEGRATRHVFGRRGAARRCFEVLR